MKRFFRPAGGRGMRRAELSNGARSSIRRPYRAETKKGISLQRLRSLWLRSLALRAGQNRVHSWRTLVYVARGKRG